jgi:HKD family nuclease
LSRRVFNIFASKSVLDAVKGFDMITVIHHPDDRKRMGDLLVENLSDTKWILFRAAVAFVKSSGVKHIKAALQKFLAQGDARISAGIDHAGTSKEGLSELLEALGTKGEGWVFHNEGPYTLHPKIYLFENASSAECFIGSGNLTEGGMYTNYEAFVHLRLDKSALDDQKTLARLQGILDTWIDSSQGLALKLTPTLIDGQRISPHKSSNRSNITRSSRESARYCDADD